MAAMNRHTPRYGCVVTAVLLFILPCASALDDQQAFRNLCEEARERSDIKAKGMPGFVLRGDVRISVKNDAATNGKYLFVWTPESRWKEEVVFPGYKRTRIGDGTQFWQVRSPEGENPAVEELDQLFRRSRTPKNRENDTLRKIELKHPLGTKPECIKVAAHPPFGFVYCFDPKTHDMTELYTGHATKDISWKVDWQEHSGFHDWGTKRIPLLLRGYNGDRVAVEARFEEIKLLPQLPSDFFDRPNGATTWADCTTGGIWNLKDRVQPEYPHSARVQRRQGTVVLSAIIEEDGRLSNLKTVHAAGPELDQSALSAVSHWRYERSASCVESKGRTETFIDVVYSLNQ